MNQSQNTQGAITQNLKEEAETLLLKHVQVRYMEALYEAKSAIDAFESATIRRVSYRPPVDMPWVSHMMNAAVMPDSTICLETVRNHAINHSEMMTIHTGPLESSFELRKEMETKDCIWGYHRDADEDDGEEQYHYAEITGFGLAKFLGINLKKFMADNRVASKQAA